MADCSSYSVSVERVGKVPFVRHRQDLMRGAYNKTTRKLFVADKVARNNTVNKYVWRGNHTKLLSDFVQL